MADPTGLATDMVKQLWKIVKRGLEYESSIQGLVSAEAALSPMFAEMEDLTRNLDFPATETAALRGIVTKMRGASLKLSTAVGWRFWLKPWYQQQIEKVDQEINGFISRWLAALTAREVLRIRNILEIRIADQTSRTVRPQILKSALETLMSESTVELHAPLMNKLRSDLMVDGGHQVLNLTGFAGSGKTTFAQRLCSDPLVRGWFKDSIYFVSVGSKVQSNGDVAKQLQDELREKGNNVEAMLLVLDDVELRSKQLVVQCWNQIASNPKSKILVISRVAIQGLGTPVHMPQLGENDALSLLRHFGCPIGTTSFTFPDDDILRQLVRGCGYFPLAIKIIGSDLQGKPKVFWTTASDELSRRGPNNSDSDYSKLFTHLQSCLSVLNDYASIREFFMDLGLFPENQMIPVTALIDMWAELYQPNEEGRYAMMQIHKLSVMNLADKVIQRRSVGSDADDYYDNHFLTQHNILRELAIKISSEQGKNSTRLIIEINGNDRQSGPQQSLCGINAFKGLIQKSVAARILSISTDKIVTPDRHIKATQAEVLVLNLKTSEYTLPKFIKEMKNLKVLIVTSYGFYSTELRNLKLLGSLRSLKRIRLQQVVVPFLGDLKNVRNLSFYMCQVKKAFEDSSMDFAKAMPHLEDLNIEYCKDLAKLPLGICDVVTLKKLSISNCHKFTELPHEIRKLGNLKLLRISYCAEFENMPESITELTNLMFLDISNCLRLRKLPDKIGELQSLKKLDMTGCSIRELPDSVMDFRNFESVICDEDTRPSWEVIKGLKQSNLDIKTPNTDITLNWLYGLGSQGFIP